MEKVDDLKDGIEEARRLLESGETWTALKILGVLCRECTKGNW